jgi:hypothetical protein
MKKKASMSIGVDARSAFATLPKAPTEVLRDVRAQMQGAHLALKSAGLKLNLARGKPTHIISKVVMRMKKWLLYIVPSVEKTA